MSQSEIYDGVVGYARSGNRQNRAALTSSFVYKGVTYPYTMVGTNPATQFATTVDVAIIPFDFVFATALAGRNGQGEQRPRLSELSECELHQRHHSIRRRGATRGILAGGLDVELQLAHADRCDPDGYPTQVIQVPQNQATLLVAAFRTGFLR